MKKFLILDGNSIINRAFYGIRPLSTKSGIPTNAVYGFLTIIKKHLDALNPDYIACAFDVHQPTFRHLEYADYKGNRKGMPDELKVQMPYAKRAAASLGFLVIECPGFEADDVIGTAAGMADDSGEIETYILTGDRDSLQLINKTTSVVLAKTKEDILFNESHFKEEYGITPTQFIDVKALMGDSSDNIPGVAGIGEKTALKLIAAAGSLDALYADEKFFGQSQSVCKKLSDGKESAFMSKELATIRRDAPIMPAEEIFTHREIDKTEFSAICEELEFSGMAKRFGIDNDTHEEDKKSAESITVKAEEGADIAKLRLNTPAAVSIRDHEAAVCTEDGTLIHYSGITANGITEFIRNNRIICHDYKGLLRSLHVSGEDTACIYDTMIAAYLINPGKSKYLLSDVSLEYTGKECDSVLAEAQSVIEIFRNTSKLLEE